MRRGGTERLLDLRVASRVRGPSGRTAEHLGAGRLPGGPAPRRGGPRPSAGESDRAADRPVQRSSGASWRSSPAPAHRAFDRYRRTGARILERARPVDEHRRRAAVEVALPRSGRRTGRACTSAASTGGVEGLIARPAIDQLLQRVAAIERCRAGAGSGGGLAGAGRRRRSRSDRSPEQTLSSARFFRCRGCTGSRAGRGRGLASSTPPGTDRWPEPRR